MLNRTNREPVVPIVVILRIDTTRVEVQVPGIASGVERSRPVVAIRAAVVPRRTIAVAGASKEKPFGYILLRTPERIKQKKPSGIINFFPPRSEERRVACEYRSEPSSLFVKSKYCRNISPQVTQNIVCLSWRQVLHG